MKKILKTLAIGVVAVGVVAGGLAILFRHDWKDEPIEKDDSMTNPAITDLGKTLVSAHRSGGDIFPENTMMAFRGNIESEDFKTDTFEFDVHLTKDKELIILHDDTFDRTSDACELFNATDIHAEDYTYEELRQLNLGEFFVALDGSTPYKGLRGEDVPDDLRVARAYDVLSYLKSQGDFDYIIEIKNEKQLGCDAADRLYAILKELGLLDKAIIGTFHNEITRYMEEVYPDMLRSAGVNEVIKFYFSALLNIKHKPGYFKFDALQIPANQYPIHLGNAKIVNYAHRNNIAVQYWTINNPEDMKLLQNAGADCIMSDNPAECYRVLNNCN
ncbi:MAG TPA: hypothetical protein GXZ23_05480 [Clostridiales bacterium]|nr:hypothetical protein [Clostridiales bacterium]